MQLNTVQISKLNTQVHPFHLVKSSPWPIIVAFSLCQILVYVVLWFHSYDFSGSLFFKNTYFGVFFFFAFGS